MFRQGGGLCRKSLAAVGSARLEQSGRKSPTVFLFTVSGSPMSNVIMYGATLADRSATNTAEVSMIQWALAQNRRQRILKALQLLVASGAIRPATLELSYSRV